MPHLKSFQEHCSLVIDLQRGQRLQRPVTLARAQEHNQEYDSFHSGNSIRQISHGMRKVTTILLWRDVFSSFQERGTGIIPSAHEELNLRHSDLLSDEPHTVRCEVRLLLGTQTVFFVPRSWTRRKNTIFFNSASVSCIMYLPTFVRRACFSNVMKLSQFASRTKVFFVSGMIRTDLHRQKEESWGNLEQNR